MKPLFDKRGAAKTKQIFTKIIRQGSLLLLFLGLLPQQSFSQVIVSSGFTVERIATVEHPTSLAFAPPGSPFGADLYVGSFTGFPNPLNPSTQILDDHVFLVSDAGEVNIFANLPGEADPINLEFPPPGSPFLDGLYIVSNNRDAGKIASLGGIGDCGGTIQRADVNGIVTDFTALTSNLLCGTPPLTVQTALPEPTGLVFAFAPGGAFGTDLYFADAGDGCKCIRTADALGNFSAPFVGLPGVVLGMKFGPGGAFGTDLYLVLNSFGRGSIFRVKPDGSLGLFASGFLGFEGADQLEFSPDGSALYVGDYSGNAIYKINARPISNVSIIDTISTVDIDLDTASFSQAPFSVTPGIDRTQIEWRFDSFAVGQVANLSYNVLLKNPLPGEDRLVNHQLEVLYTDLNGNPVRTALGPQSVSVLNSAFATVASTDKLNYTANENVLTNLSITNLSGFPRTITSIVDVEDAQGNFVQILTTFSGLSLLPEATQALLPPAFNTGAIFAGDYRIHVRLIEAGTQVGETTADFTILPVIQAASTIVSDKIAYASNESVTLTSLVASQSSNSLLTGLGATVTVLDPLGIPVFSETRSLSDLLPGASLAFDVFFNTATHPAGAYSASLQVNGSGGPLMTTNTPFEIISSLQQANALSGTLVVNPNSILETESTTLTYTIQNTGNDPDLSVVSIEVLVIDPDTGLAVRTITEQATLIGRASYSSTVPFDSTGLAPKAYLAVLRGTAAGAAQTIDSAGLRINPSPNRLPVAEAGPDQSVLPGDSVHLNGVGSSDLDGDSLTFIWAFLSKPTGSAAALLEPTSVRPTFGVDLPGTYMVQLTVSDGSVNEGLPCDADFNGIINIPDIQLILAARGMAASGPDDPRDADGDGMITIVDGRICVLRMHKASDTVIISTQNAPPAADAGTDQTVFVGNTVTLDGSRSSDVDGDPLSFSWSLTPPPGSTAVLSDPSGLNPTFQIDLPGSYLALLIVNDGLSYSRFDTVTTSTLGSPPVADAGPDQHVFAGETVTLDGSGSSDVDGDPLNYSWALISKPSGSAAALPDPTAAALNMAIDLPGDYVVQLIVQDGQVDSPPDTMMISTVNLPPDADAGPDQSVFVGGTVTLDGSGSGDVDGDPLSYSWSLISKPLGSGAILFLPATTSPTFVPDLPGTYVVQLIVNDGPLNSDPNAVKIITIN